jgi:hypothetical protein
MLAMSRTYAAAVVRPRFAASLAEPGVVTRANQGAVAALKVATCMSQLAVVVSVAVAL